MTNRNNSDTDRITTPWYDALVNLVVEEISKGRMVRISLPGSSYPILVEGAAAWCGMLTISDAAGRIYYAASPAGVVLITEPVELPPPGSKPYWMTVDEPDAKPS